MTMTMKIKQKRILYESIIVFAASLRISALNLNNYVMVMVRMVLIGLFILPQIKRRRFSKDFLVFLGWFGIITVSTILNRKSLYSLVEAFSSIFLISLFYMYIRDENQKIRALSVWAGLLFLLCVVDGITMILYPHGMRTTSYYQLTWFLGYKTARMVYILPMVVLFPYLSYVKNGHVLKRDFGVIIFCILLSIKAEATAATAVLVMYVALLLLLMIKHSNAKWERRIYRLFDPLILSITYGTLFSIVTIIQTNQYVLYVVQNIFGKSSDLSHRTLIWGECFRYFNQRKLIGCGYLSAADYVNITNFRLGTSAHSMILSILVTCGVIGLIYYMFMFFWFINNRTHKYEKHQVIAIFGILSAMMIGLISSTLIFSAFSFLLFQLVNSSCNRLKAGSGTIKDRKEFL